MVRILYIGCRKTKLHPGTELDSLPDSMPNDAWDAVVWNWALGVPPEFLTNPPVGLVLLGAEDDISLYAEAAKRNFCAVISESDETGLDTAIEKICGQIWEQRRYLACQSLFDRYGNQLQMHLWHDLIMEGSHQELLAPGRYRLLLLYRDTIPMSAREPVRQHPMRTRDIAAKLFPESIAIVALREGWEGVALSESVPNFAQRAERCRMQLEKLTGQVYHSWSSPPLLPEDVHGFYLTTVSAFLRESVSGRTAAVSALVCSYIHGHLGEKLTRKSLSEQLFFSPDYLAKVFHAEMGITLGTYICSARLERAQDLLANTDMPISAIASELGYGNFSEFSFWFRQQLHITPSAYRKKAHSELTV